MPNFRHQTLGVCAPDNHRMDPSLLFRWRSFFDLSRTHRATFRVMVFDESQRWRQGERPEDRYDHLDLLQEAVNQGFTPLLRWVPFTRFRPGYDLNRQSLDRLKDAAAAVVDWLTPVKDQVIFAPFNLNPANWKGSPEGAYQAQGEVFREWDALGVKVAIGDDKDPVTFFKDSPSRTAYWNNHLPNALAFHAYGKHGWDSTHVKGIESLFRSKGWNGPVYWDECHRWFWGRNGKPSEHPELFSVETGAYLADIVRKASDTPINLALYSIDSFFSKDGNPYPSTLTMRSVLVDGIPAKRWKPPFPLRLKRHYQLRFA